MKKGKDGAGLSRIYRIKQDLQDLQDMSRIFKIKQDLQDGQDSQDSQQVAGEQEWQAGVGFLGMGIFDVQPCIYFSSQCS